MLAIRISAAALGLALLGAAIATETGTPVPARLAPAKTGLLAGHFRPTTPDGTTVDSDAPASFAARDGNRQRAEAPAR